MRRCDTPPPLTWQDLFSSWKIACMTSGLSMASEVTFQEILVRFPQGTLRIGEHLIDWWPTARVAEWRAVLARNGIPRVSWNIPKGTLHTANLLRACGSNSEAQAAVLIAASVWDKHNNLPTTWYGDTHTPLDQMRFVILRARRSVSAAWPLSLASCDARRAADQHHGLQLCSVCQAEGLQGSRVHRAPGRGTVNECLDSHHCLA